LQYCLWGISGIVPNFLHHRANRFYLGWNKAQHKADPDFLLSIAVFGEIVCSCEPPKTKKTEIM
jgi:hypothetical protein